MSLEEISRVHTPPRGVPYYPSPTSRDVSGEVSTTQENRNPLVTERPPTAARARRVPCEPRHIPEHRVPQVAIIYRTPAADGRVSGLGDDDVIYLLCPP